VARIIPDLFYYIFNAPGFARLNRDEGGRKNGDFVADAN